MNKYIKRLLSDTFLEEVDNESLKSELLKTIYEAVEYRIENNITQKQFSKIKGLNLSTLKRIEHGKCYDLKLINKYIKTN